LPHSSEAFELKMLQSLESWFHCFWVCGEREHHQREHVVVRTWLSSWQLGSKDRGRGHELIYTCQGHIPNDLLPHLVPAF
jgi:hypothetical protein